MRSPKITNAQKDAICTIYLAKTKTITEIAMFLNVSQRTVGRVLKERGIETPKQQYSASANKVLGILYANKIDPEHLEAMINTPALNAGSVVTYLQQCSRKELYVLFHTAGLVGHDDVFIDGLVSQALLNAPVNKPGAPIPTKAAQMSLLDAKPEE